MDRTISAGIFGTILAFLITFFLPIPIYLQFLPTFIASIVVIYSFRLGSYKDGLLVAFVTYVSYEGIVGTISLASYYLIDEPYPSFTIDIPTLLTPIMTSIATLIAGYLGALLARTRRPMQETPSTTATTPPIPPV